MLPSTLKLAPTSLLPLSVHYTNQMDKCPGFSQHLIESVLCSRSGNKVVDANSSRKQLLQPYVMCWLAASHLQRLHKNTTRFTSTSRHVVTVLLSYAAHSARWLYPGSSCDHRTAADAAGWLAACNCEVTMQKTNDDDDGDDWMLLSTS